MGQHANALAKHKIRAAQEHLRAALVALASDDGDGVEVQLVEAQKEISNAKALVE
jgi:hypothetical protein